MAWMLSASETRIKPTARMDFYFALPPHYLARTSSSYSRFFVLFLLGLIPTHNPCSFFLEIRYAVYLIDVVFVGFTCNSIYALVTAEGNRTRHVAASIIVVAATTAFHFFSEWFLAGWVKRQRRRVHPERS